MEGVVAVVDVEDDGVEAVVVTVVVVEVVVVIVADVVVGVVVADVVVGVVDVVVVGSVGLTVAALTEVVGLLTGRRVEVVVGEGGGVMRRRGGGDEYRFTQEWRAMVYLENRGSVHPVHPGSLRSSR